jgi:hydrogenase maturation protease
VIRVIGVGNPGSGDDAAGREVARRLSDREPRGLDVRESDGEATALMTAWEDAGEVVVIDACRGPGPPGHVHVLDTDDVERLAPLRAASTHSFGVAAAMGLARALGRLPSRLTVYAVEGRSFREATPLSPEVDRAVDALVARLEGEGRATA